MNNQKYALVLTGELLSGFNADSAWPKLATQFHMDNERLRSEALARAPLTIKESEDLPALKSMLSAIKNIGADAEIHAVEEGRNLFVLIDNIPRGPLPLAFVRQRIRRGVWSPTTRVAAVGSSDWRTLEPEALSATAPPPAPADMPAVDDADTVAAKIARVAGGIAGRLDQVRVLPPGAAIHAGFWRRTAAYLIDTLVLFVPAMILNFIPIIGLFFYLIGRWLYYALMESSAAQASIGKRAMGLIVTDGKGQRIGFGQATGRYFGGALSYILLYFGYMMAGWTARKQALHDLMADTCVVFDSVRPDQDLPRVRPPMPWYGWVVNCLLLAIVPVSILAAIALPAYNDYVMRARISEAFTAVSDAKIEVAEAVVSGNACPEGQRSSSNPMVDSIRLGGTAPACIITLVFNGSATVPAAARDQAVEWQYSSDNGWACSSMIQPKYLPAACRP